MLTDNEIIKALEYCANHDNVDACDDCPYLKGECISTTPYVLDLINRQKAEIESNKAKIKISAECIARQDKEIERLKTELKEDSRTMKQALVLLDELKQDIANDITTAKAEAVKEFAERLDERMTQILGTPYTHCIIDNLVKEMVGED